MEAARAIGASGIGLVRTNNGQPMSIWEFFWESFNFTVEPGLYTYAKSNPTLAGLAPYLLNKLWGINYFSVTGPTSDAENHMNLVNGQGYITFRFVRPPFFPGSAELDISNALSIGTEGFYGQGKTMREIREYPVGPGALLFLKMRG